MICIRADIVKNGSDFNCMTRRDASGITYNDLHVKSSKDIAIPERIPEQAPHDPNNPHHPYTQTTEKRQQEVDQDVKIIKSIDE